MSIRHRLNAIVIVLVAALLMVLAVLGTDVRSDFRVFDLERARLEQLETIWTVAGAAARYPDDTGPARDLVRKALADVRAHARANDDRKTALLFNRLLQSATPLYMLQLLRQELPNVADPFAAGASVDAPDLVLTRLLVLQLPDLLWRMATLRDNAYKLAVRARLGPRDRMLFLVNAGQFKAGADTIETGIASLHTDAGNVGGDAALDAAIATYSAANQAFQKQAGDLAWKINITAATRPLTTIDPQHFDVAYVNLVEASLALHAEAARLVTGAVAARLEERRWTLIGIVATAALITVLALLLGLSLSRSIVRAFQNLETRIHRLADEAGTEIQSAPLPEAEGQSELARIARAVIYYRDKVAERVKRAERDEKRRDLEMMFESNPLPLIVHEPDDGAIITVNGTAVDHYGYSREEFRKLTLAELRAPSNDVCVAVADGRAPVRHLKADRDTIDVLPFEREIRFGAQMARLTTIVDISARRRAENQLAFLAHFDPLTQLANRVMLQKRLTAAITRGAGSPDRGFALLCLDLDRFKIVNDTLGHDAGDQVLRAVADRLTEIVGPEDTVARLGGDEFTILVGGPDGAERAEAVSEAVCEALKTPYLIAGARLVLGGSVGLCRYPEDGTTGEDLMKHADLALHHAKANGRGMVCVFTSCMDEELRRRQSLENDLREALEQNRLELHYQPLIDMKTHRISGFEALLRWNDPERGQVPPSQFIPVAEEVGLIEEIGTWVLNEATREVARWPNGVKVAVNVSSNQFRGGHLVERVREALAESRLEPDRLELEITESVLLADSEATLRTLHEIRALGVRIAMDDFGTGYSSLSYLRSFPFDKVKIDRSFIRDLGNAAEANAIIRAIAGLSSELGMATTAEGIETEEQLQHVRAHGCSEAQGFLTGRPAPAREARILAGSQSEALRAVLTRMKGLLEDRTAEMLDEAAG